MVEDGEKRGLLLQKMVKTEGITENPNVIRLRREKCVTCLKQMTCNLIMRARRAKHIKGIEGLFVTRAKVNGIWQRVMDCREFVHMPGNQYKIKKQKDAYYVGDLFRKGDL